MVHTDYSDNIFLWVMQPYNARKTVQIYHSDTGVTETIADEDIAVGLKFNRPLINYFGIGKFTLKLVNNTEKYTDKFKKDDKVTIKLDHDSGTRRQFYGIVENVTNEFNMVNGNILVLEGIHISRDAAEGKISATLSNIEASSVIITVIKPKISGATSSNVNATTTTIPSKTWNYENIVPAITFVCDASGHDCYIDDDIDIHLFQSESIYQNEDAAVYSPVGNIEEVPNLGKASESIVEKVTAIGQNDSGLMIISTSGTGSKYKVIKDNNIRTDSSASLYASSKIDTEEEIGKVKVRLLAKTNPGDMLYTEVPQMNISKYFKVVNLTYYLAEDMVWYTDVEIVKSSSTLSEFMKERFAASVAIESIENPNEMTDSYTFSFDDDSNIESLSGIIITGGKAVLTSGSSNGTLITTFKDFGFAFSALEFRTVGSQTGSSKFYYRNNSADSWTEITSFNSLISSSGSQLQMKIVLNSDNTYTAPEIEAFGGYVKGA